MTELIIIRRSKKTEAEFDGVASEYKYKLVNEYFIDMPSAKAKQTVLLDNYNGAMKQAEIDNKISVMDEMVKDMPEDIVVKPHTLDKDWGQLEDAYFSKSPNKTLNETTGCLEETTFEKLKQPLDKNKANYTNEISTRNIFDENEVSQDDSYFEGYFNLSRQKENTYIAVKYVKGQKTIVLSNEIKKKGFYECKIKPMKTGRGFLVVTFTHNIDKERKARKEYFARIDAQAKLQKDKQADNKTDPEDAKR